MTSGGFWPGEPPAGDEEDVHEPERKPEPSVPDPPSWPLQGVEREEPTRPPEPEPEPEPPVLPSPILPPEAAPAAPPVEGAATEPALAADEPDETSEPDDLVSRAFAAAERLLAESSPPASVPEPAPRVHVPGELDIPDEVATLEGSPSGADRTVGVVVSRFNGEISNQLLASALSALAEAGVAEERITVMPVPGAFELPIGAMALAKTRRYSCVIALGCVVRGETSHFDYVASEAASGLQLAGLETGVPVAFGVLTVDSRSQAEARTDRGADAARAALEMADLFGQLRAQANNKA